MSEAPPGQGKGSVSHHSDEALKSSRCQPELIADDLGPGTQPVKSVNKGFRRTVIDAGLEAQFRARLEQRRRKNG